MAHHSRYPRRRSPDDLQAAIELHLRAWIARFIWRLNSSTPTPRLHVHCYRATPGPAAGCWEIETTFRPAPPAASPDSA